MPRMLEVERPVVGANEVSFDALRDEVGPEAVEQGCVLPSHFRSVRPILGDRADEIHAWLSANAKSAWLWSEGWSGKGTSLDVRVFLERLPDRDAFEDAFGWDFRRSRAEEANVRAIALLRGAVAPVAEDDDFAEWADARSGYEIGWRGETMTVRATTDFARRAIAGRYGDAFAREDGTWLVPPGQWFDERSPTKVAEWLRDNCGIGGPAGEVAGGARWAVAVPDPAVRAAFAAKWGEGYAWDEASGRMVGDAPPRIAPMPVPSDFVDYLDGKRDDYERSFAAAPSP